MSGPRALDALVAPDTRPELGDVYVVDYASQRADGWRVVLRRVDIADPDPEPLETLRDELIKRAQEAVEVSDPPAAERWCNCLAALECLRK